jgi:hypothetical protein
MKINKSELLKALEIVKPGLANKEIIEQSTSFAFINGKVITFNDEICLSHPIAQLNIEGAIKAEEFYKLLSKVKKEEMEIDLIKNEIIISCGKMKAGLTLQSEIKLSLDQVAAPGKWKKIPNQVNFIKYLKLASASCGRDMSRPILTCIHVSKEGFIEASDNYQIIRCELGEEMPVDSFLIPASSAMIIINLRPNKITLSDGWVHFMTEENTMLSCRIFSEEYPDIGNLLDIEGIHIEFPKTLAEILDRATIFAKQDHIMDESVKITIGNKRIKVESESQYGWFKEEANVHFSDSPFTFSILIYLLKDILKETSVCTLSDNCMKFTGEGWSFITTLNEMKE